MNLRESRLAHSGPVPAPQRPARPVVGLLPLVAAVLALAMPAWARAELLDQGTFKIYLRGRALGSENFFYDQYSDSIVIESNVHQKILTPSGDTDLDKAALLHVSSFDLDLRLYHSNQTLGGTHKVVRDLVMSDTSFTSYREENGHGDGDVLVRPPGRLYVHDPDVYTLFDVISRNLHGQQFDTRPITLMVLGPRDTTIEITVRRLPAQPLQWGARTVQAERLQLDDGSNKIDLWSDPRGRLLQLEEKVAGLRVVRTPPARTTAKRRPAKK